MIMIVFRGTADDDDEDGNDDDDDGENDHEDEEDEFGGWAADARRTPPCASHGIFYNTLWPRNAEIIPKPKVLVGFRHGRAAAAAVCTLPYFLQWKTAAG